MKWRSILASIRRAIWPVPSDFIIGQCTACFRETEGLLRTTSGLMCPTCAREWATHEAEQQADRISNLLDAAARRSDPAPRLNINITPGASGTDVREVMEAMQREIARATGVPRSMIDNCPQGRDHDWLPWLNGNRERQGDICANCGTTRREALAVERPPIPCEHRWITEENLADRTIIVTCRTCRETHEVNREVLEDGDPAHLGFMPQFRGGTFVGGTLPGGRVTARTPIPARPRATPPNQGGSGQSPTGRRRRDPAPQSVPVPKPKPKRLQPGAKRRRPLILDDDPEGSA